MEEISEKEKNKWKNFNTKVSSPLKIQPKSLKNFKIYFSIFQLSSKTWKGVVKKNKFETRDDHENKIGVGTNSSANRIVSANGTILPTNSTVSAAAASATALANSSKSRPQTQSFKASMF